jgi:hypothetical protein
MSTEIDRILLARPVAERLRPPTADAAPASYSDVAMTVQ